MLMDALRDVNEVYGSTRRVLAPVHREFGTQAPGDSVQ
jgi:hypothetical protein